MNTEQKRMLELFQETVESYPDRIILASIEQWTKLRSILPDSTLELCKDWKESSNRILDKWQILIDELKYNSGVGLRLSWLEVFRFCARKKIPTALVKFAFLLEHARETRPSLCLSEKEHAVLLVSTIIALSDANSLRREEWKN